MRVMTAGKADCLVIDFTDKYHRLDKESDLLALDMMFEECDGEWRIVPPAV